MRGRIRARCRNQTTLCVGDPPGRAVDRVWERCQPLNGFLEIPIFRRQPAAGCTKEVHMNMAARLQFQRLPPEARRAALWRLAWSGMGIEQIADRVGWSVDQVRRTLDEESIQPAPAWQLARKWSTAQSRPA